MVGQVITDEKGNPIDSTGNRLSKSAYQPNDEVKKLWARVQTDYQVSYVLHHRGFKEFDGYSPLQRAKMDQETFAAYVGCEYVPVQNRWRWKGRKNTARNKLIGILAHMLSGMLYPYVNAKNTANEDDKMTARVMKILIEDYLKKAKYETQFIFMVLSALVNPAVYVEVEWVEAIQRVKEQTKKGAKVIEVVDEFLSGLNLNIIPFDEILVNDVFSGTGKLHRVPCVLRVRRISYDEARAKYAGKYKIGDEDAFNFVEPGKTRIVMTGNENQELFDIEWTEADRNYVQEITAYYRGEDLEAKFVGGVFMGNDTDVYNTNPFTHRRLVLIDDEWVSVPVLPFAMSGFEPIDPAGRFLWYKSAAYKEYWDDQALNNMHRLALDATYLDVIKPMFLSGVARVDTTVISPGATIGMPQGSTATPYNLGPNLKAAYDAIAQQEKDMSNSTQAEIMQGTTDPNQTATQTNQAVMQAKIMMGCFSIMIADLLTQVGELTKDCIIDHATTGEVTDLAPGALSMKFKTLLAKGKEKGKDITHRVIFTDKHMGKKYTKEKIDKVNWGLYDQTGDNHRERYHSDQRIYEVNPYQFARTTYTLGVDVDQMLDKSLGATRSRKIQASNILLDPRIQQFTDIEQVADGIIDEFGRDLVDDPEKLKKKGQAMMPGQMPMQPGAQGAGPPSPLGNVGDIQQPTVGQPMQ